MEKINIETILKQILEVDRVCRVEVSKNDNPNFTHVLIGLDKRDKEVTKVLFNEKDNSIFRIIKPENKKKKKKKKEDIILISELNEINKDSMFKAITHAVLLTIKEHGDITPQFAASSAKRIVGELMTILKNDK